MSAPGRPLRVRDASGEHAPSRAAANSVNASSGTMYGFGYDASGNVTSEATEREFGGTTPTAWPSRYACPCEAVGLRALPV